MQSHLQLRSPHLRSLPPRTPHAQQRTRRSRQSHNTIIQIDPAQRRARDSNVAQIADKLDLHGVELLLDFLVLDDLLRVGGAVDRLGALEKGVVRVHAGDDGEGDSCEPGAVAFA